MSRPVTLFTGQWADLPIADLAPKAKSFGYDGLELACWGDHFDVQSALADPGYTRARRELLERHDLNCWAISIHLVGQAVCDPIDERHRSVLPSSIWAQLYSFPPNDFEAVAAGYVDFAERWGPIIDVFDQEGVRFGLEVHPTEIAYDFVTTRRTLQAIDHRPGFGINFDPSHLIPQ